jgi:hypothetical protein
MKFYEVSNKYNNKKYQKVSILITRMGHFYPGMLGRISDQTDYAIRIPIYEYNPYNAKFTDVYIDSEQRIRASLPEYPYYRQRHGHTSAYYGNITTPIKNTVFNFFEDRGKEVYDVQVQAVKWEPKLSELKISDILKKLNGVSDILFVLHYMDVGYYRIKGGGINSETKGRFLNNLYNSIAIFDLDTGERILFRDGGLVSRISVIDRMVHDKQLMNNPKFNNRIKYEKSKATSGAFIQISENFSTDLSPDEIVDIAMIYLERDLNKIIP